MKLLREPLVHFLLLGAVLFGVFALVGDRGSERASHAPVDLRRQRRCRALAGALHRRTDRRRLVQTISSFTVAHSLTLALATLGYARAPEPPLTAAIALSILFLGPEIVRAQRGETSLTIRHPWVVAFAFGLLHGFGFASGLTTMGLPRAEIPLALLLFNLGVEAGQLLCVLMVLTLARACRVLDVRLPRRLEALPAYAVGSLGAFWTIQRLAIMLGGGR